MKLAFALLPLLIAGQPLAAEPASGPVSPKQLLTNWVDVQNRGDFAAYQALYADRFGGIRRSGTRTVTLDRKGWMRDRERMFQKKMVISVQNESISADSATAQVSFTQNWASAGYKDSGPKQLILVRQKHGSWRISREEMLASVLQKTPHVPEDLPPTFFSHVKYFKKRNLCFVLLATQKSFPPDVPRELIERQPESDIYGIMTKLAPSDVPEEMRAWKQRSVRLYNDADEVGEAKIETFATVNLRVPHFGSVSEWEGIRDYDGEKPFTDGQIATALIKGGQNYLAAQVVVQKGSCAEANWAQDSSAKVPIVSKADNFVASAVEKKVAQQFEKLAPYRQLQKDYLGYPDKSGPWHKYEGGSLKFSTYKQSGHTYIGVSTGWIGSNCGEFGGSLGALFELTRQNTTILLYTADDIPDLLTDFDGDGQPEFFSPGVGGYILQDAKPGYQKTNMQDIPNYDCPC